MCMFVDVGVNSNTSKQHTHTHRMIESLRKMLCKHNPVLIFPSKTHRMMYGKTGKYCICIYTIIACVSVRACGASVKAKERKKN